MNQLSTAQWDTMQAAHQGRFRQHLVLAIETRFGRPEGGSDLRSPEQVVDAALAFAEAVGATTDAQVARIAALLATVNRQRLTHDQVGEPAPSSAAGGQDGRRAHRRCGRVPRHQGVARRAPRRRRFPDDRAIGRSGDRCDDIADVEARRS